MSWFLKVVAYGLGGMIVLLTGAVIGIWVWTAKDLPDPRASLSPSATICPAAGAGKTVRVTELPRHVTESFIIVVEPGFRTSWGTPTLRAFAELLLGLYRTALGRPEPKMQAPISAMLAGQQLVTTNLNESRTLNAQVRRIVQADRIELALNREEILEAALNQVYMGRQLHGYACGATVHFGKPAADLTIAEAALLGTLVKSPSAYDPIRYPERAAEARNRVIDGLREAGVISQTEAAAAMSEPLPGQSK